MDQQFYGYRITCERETCVEKATIYLDDGPEELTATKTEPHAFKRALRLANKLSSQTAQEAIRQLEAPEEVEESTDVFAEPDFPAETSKPESPTDAPD